LLTVAILETGPATAQAVLQITVQGESPLRTNIPIAADPEAAGDRYLALDTAERPPRPGWFATYQVAVPNAGVYRMDAVITAPAMPDRRPYGGSYFNLSVNGSPFAQVAESELHWADWEESPIAWGSLVWTRLPDVELRRGANTITFMVDEPRISAPPVHYNLFLDEFTLRPTDLALNGVYIGDPASNLGIYRGPKPPRLHLRLNGHAPADQTVRYSVMDYFSRRVTSGTATISAEGTTATVELPVVPPGNYRVDAQLSPPLGSKAVGYFARLPERKAVEGPGNRFAVAANSIWLVPPSRLEAFATAVEELGPRYVREEIHWPVIEQQRGRFDASTIDGLARVFHRHGLKVLGAMWDLVGNTESPRWARARGSVRLPADLRDAYNLGRRLAADHAGIGRDAIELWNEPDVDIAALDLSRMTGDQHAAYIKAAALGIADTPRRPLISLSGIAFPGPFQDVMLQNEVARYADAWAYHAYPDTEGNVPFAWMVNPFPPKFPATSHHNNWLRRLYGANSHMWLTEGGIFLPPDVATKFTPALAGVLVAENGIVSPDRISEPHRQVAPTQDLTPSPYPDLTPEQLIIQARYTATSIVQDFAAGTDKHVEFTVPPYCAGGIVCFGLLSRDFQPRPSYSAYAALASVLGEANFAHQVTSLGSNVRGYVFRNRRQAVTVVWAESQMPKAGAEVTDPSVQVEVPVPGTKVDLYDIMGHRLASPRVGAQRTVRVTATPDPIYLVSDGGTGLPAKPTADDAQRRMGRLPAEDHVVLSQRFPASAAPQPPPFGYRLGAVTEMFVDVYNFSDAPQTVTVTGHAWGGWSVTPARAAAVGVPPGGRRSVPFTIRSGGRVRHQVDYPLVFEATVGGVDTPPSVSRIQRRGGIQGERIQLAPSITGISPSDGATVSSNAELTAHITDGLSGVHPKRISVEVDGRPVRFAFDPESGMLSARLRLAPGSHEVWIRAYNHAHAPSQAFVHLTARQG
jgi:hypothetical protein